jgi:hypothetical protein
MHDWRIKRVPSCVTEAKMEAYVPLLTQCAELVGTPQVERLSVLIKLMHAVPSLDAGDRIRLLRIFLKDVESFVEMDLAYISAHEIVPTACPLARQLFLATLTLAVVRMTAHEFYRSLAAAASQPSTHGASSGMCKIWAFQIDDMVLKMEGLRSDLSGAVANEQTAETLAHGDADAVMSLCTHAHSEHIATACQVVLSQIALHAVAADVRRSVSSLPSAAEVTAVHALLDHAMAGILSV